MLGPSKHIETLESKVDSLATKVETILNKFAGTVDTNAEEVVQDTRHGQSEPPDPYLAKLNEARGAILDKMVQNGGPILRYVVGRRGTTEVNETKLALNMIQDQVKDWIDKKTHNKV